jgi:uncharacterized protein (DUF1684 family)
MRSIRRTAFRSVVVQGLLLLLAAGAEAQSFPDAAYRRSFEQWKTELIEDLKQNWLPLAGLFWLKAGENSFGTDPGNAIVLPPGSAPAQAGSFVLEGNGHDVIFKLAPGVHAAIAGQPVGTTKLESDASGKATWVELGGLRMKVIVRGTRIGIRVKDLNSPAVRAYPGPEFYPLDLNYRVTATWVPADGKTVVDVPDVLGDLTPTPVAGKVQFTLNGHALELTDLGGNPTKGLFFVLNDSTSKTATYPGGRFLDTDPVVNGKVVLDFNRAYSPPCSVTPYATCPLAPKENRLTVAIDAGQKYDRKQVRH